jgi:hypothetical protein
MPLLADATKRPRIPRPLTIAVFNSHWCNGAKLQIKCRGAAGRLAQRPSGEETGPADLPENATDTLEMAAPNGLVAVDWWLENNALMLSQQVEAALFDATGLIAGPLRFNANLSIARRVSFDNKPTRQEAEHGPRSNRRPVWPCGSVAGRARDCHAPAKGQPASAQRHERGGRCFWRRVENRLQRAGRTADPQRPAHVFGHPGAPLSL